ncbi:hypothetical protein C8R44DRAFT_717397 [Mycena epipterygia]|nr:hypothetical protein C8R44DRAFT_717397 [Mycena epipterygia]
MDRFPCQGYLHVTVRDGDDTIGIRLSHHQAHCQYVDISIDEEIKGIIEEMKNSPASAIWDRILREHPSTELTRKQIYARWARLNESVWKLDADQVKSATLLLERLDGEKIEIIPVEKEVGIDAIAFSFINILREFGGQIEEIAMDSTWKTNSLGHELYGIVGEANGQAIPTSFMFMGTSEDAETGAKERTLRHLIRNVKQHCKNIMFTGSDKDTTEINGFRAEIPQAKHQLCYIHAISYIEKRLAEDRPPAAYDPRVANRSFRFIDPTWAPGVSSGWLEDGVSEEDAEMEKPVPSASEIQSEQVRIVLFNFSLLLNRNRKTRCLRHAYPQFLSSKLGRCEFRSGLIHRCPPKCHFRLFALKNFAKSSFKNFAPTFISTPRSPWETRMVRSSRLMRFIAEPYGTCMTSASKMT